MGNSRIKDGLIFAVAILLAFALALGGGLWLHLHVFNDGDEAETVISELELFKERTEDELRQKAALSDTYAMIIGDSLTVGAKSELAKRFDNLSVDAEVGRGMGTGLEILQRRIDAGLVVEGDIVVIALANNVHTGSIESAEEIVELLPKGTWLVFVTGHGLSNMDPVNDALRKLAAEYEFITIADWDVAISAETGLLAGDGIHVANATGNALYAHTVAEAAATVLSFPPKS